MLRIKDLYKEKKNHRIKALDIEVSQGSSISIECSNEISDLLVDLILNREIPAKGEIELAGIKNRDYLRQHGEHIGVIFREDSLYEKHTIEEYMKFFACILNAKVDYREILLKLALLDVAGTRIKDLSYSQRRRLSLARERLKQPKLLIFQEPILNMDRDGRQLIIENIEELCAAGTAVMITSVFFKDIILLGERAYCYTEGSVVELEHRKEEQEEPKPPEQESRTYQIEKIPARVEERLLLFDPVEIDYVESEEGISSLYVRGEKFPCSLSLTELEERLKYFGFFRCHRSYIVNLQRVREVVTWTRNSYSLSLGDKAKSTVPLSKGRLEELKAILKL